MGQAWFVATTGVTLGAAVGFVPGLAAAVREGPRMDGPFGLVSVPGVTVPWLAIAFLVVLLPLVAGLVAALFTRGRIAPARRIT